MAWLCTNDEGSFEEWKSQFKSQVQTFLMKYHNCPHTTTGNSLAVMLMGHPLRCRLDLLKPDITRTWKKCYMKCGVWNQMKIWSSHLAEQFKQLSREAEKFRWLNVESPEFFSFMRQLLKLSSQVRGSYLHLITRTVEKALVTAQSSQQMCHFNIGTLVLARNSERGELWSEGIVWKQTGPVSYQVQVGTSTWRRHLDQLRRSLLPMRGNTPVTMTTNEPKVFSPKLPWITVRYSFDSWYPWCHKRSPRVRTEPLMI